MKKLLVWDADETLWSGTLLQGEQAFITPERIALVRELRDRGVLQSIASHNLYTEVMSVLSRYQIADCFLSVQANMPVTKSFMIKTIMEELGIARLEDVVYVDDQPFNLSEVFKALPGVAVCLPNSIDVVVREFFTKENYTDEDRSRVARYRSEEARNRASINYKGDYLEFLSTCDMTAQVRVPEEHEIDRVLDLIQRANRLSIMSAVVPEAELRADRQFIRACWSKDKFGDNGLIGVLYARHNVVSIFVVSCTMQNKGIGSYLLGSVINEHLGSQLTVGWKPTEYNKPMLQLLNYFGFKRDESMDEVLKDGIELYRLKATQAVDLPYWIKPYER